MLVSFLQGLTNVFFVSVSSHAKFSQLNRWFYIVFGDEQGLLPIACEVPASKTINEHDEQLWTMNRIRLGPGLGLWQIYLKFYKKSMVTLCSSSSLAIASSMCLGVILVFLLSLAALPANSKISADRYSITAA